MQSHSKSAFYQEFKNGKFLLLLGFALILRIICFQGLQFSDDLALMEQAWRMADGSFRFGEWEAGPLPNIGAPNYPQRLGIILPVGILFKIFGINESAAYLFTLLTSLITISAIYLAASRLFSKRAGIIAATIFTILPSSVLSATSLYAQYSASAFGNLALALLCAQLFKNSSSKLIGLTAGLLLGYSWLCSEEIAFVVPTLTVIFLYTFLRKNWVDFKTLLWTGLTAVAVVGLECIIYQTLTGDLLFRLHQMEFAFNMAPRSSAAYLADFAHTTWRELFKRWILGGPKPIFLSLDNCFAGSFALIGIARAYFRKDTRFMLPSLWFLLIAATYNFGSVSLSTYRPLILEPRMMGFIIFPAILLIAGLLDDLLEKDIPKLGLLKKFSEADFWGAVIVTIILITSIFEILPMSRGGSFRSPEYLVSRALKSRDILYSDGRSVPALIFYTIGRDGIVFKEYDKFKPENIESGAYIFVNQPKLNFLSTYYGYTPPPFIQNPPPHWELLWEVYGGKLYRKK